MKTRKLFFVSLISLTLLGTGCVSTPRITRVVPVSIAPTPTNATTLSYSYSQEPAKRTIGDDGGAYKAHVREMQKMRLAHERRLAAIEQAAQEQDFAKSRGVSIQTPQVIQTQVQSVQKSGPAVFSYDGGNYYGNYGRSGGFVDRMENWFGRNSTSFGYYPNQVVERGNGVSVSVFGYGDFTSGGGRDGHGHRQR